MQQGSRSKRRGTYGFLLGPGANKVFTYACRALTVMCILPSSAQEKSYVGAEACRLCHPAEHAGQSESGHALTLHRSPRHPLAESFTPNKSLERSPKFHFQYLLTQRDFRVQAHDNEYLLELPLEWAFGAGRQGVTFVSRINAQAYLEHAFTYYSSTNSLEITPGHEVLQPKTLHEAMGLPYSVSGGPRPIEKCFQCHSTGPVAISPKQEVQVREPGVRCGVCHGPGDAHVEAIGRGEVDEARRQIVNPGSLSGEELVEFCGTCHRFPGSDQGAIDWSLPWNVRHQPPYLRQSKCYQNSDGTLSCLTCHDLHEPVRLSDPAYYRRKCVNCHDARKRSPAEACEAENPSDCTNCHMPTVAIHSHMNAKNHWIGIYLDGATLKPSR